jgi:Flp pilus assembly protein TadG
MGLMHRFENLGHRLRDFCRTRGGNIAITFAISLIPVLGLVGAGVDYGRASLARATLQAAADSTALAMNQSASTLTASQIQSQAVSYFNGIFNRPGTQNVAVTATYTKGVGTTNSTLLISASASVPTSMLAILGVKTMNISVTSQVTGAQPKTIALNLVFDSSASMIVGATTSDVTKITTWVSNNWLQVKPGDPPPYTNADNPPCAFACHDLGDSTTAANIVQGLTNAHSAGATTRFDVMIAAAKQLITHVQTEVQTNTQLNKNTYLFNVMSFDTSLHTWGSSNMSFSAATTAVNSVTPGLDTHLSTALTTLITQIGSQGTGASSSSPLKFMILITDGLQSDRDGNWQDCAYWGYDPYWNWSSTCFGGTPYPATISSTQCNQIKNNGIILAILETPYVPLTGQDPNETPYEGSVRHVIYPNGPNTSSVVSAALSACATSGYYYQASSSTDIATGFTTLTDQFLNSTPYLSK